VSLSVLADWASIFALLISAFNAFQITTVKRRMMLNVTLNPLLNRLMENSRDMNRCLLNYQATIADIDKVIGICEADARALKRRFGLRHGRFCKNLLDMLIAYRRDRSEDSARAVYNSLQAVIREVAHRAEEMRVTGP
jgi:hypothetical protein